MSHNRHGYDADSHGNLIGDHPGHASKSTQNGILIVRAVACHEYSYRHQAQCSFNIERTDIHIGNYQRDIFAADVQGPEGNGCGDEHCGHGGHDRRPDVNSLISITRNYIFFGEELNGVGAELEYAPSSAHAIRAIPVAEIAQNLSFAPDHKHGTDVDHGRDYSRADDAYDQGKYGRFLGLELRDALNYSVQILSLLPIRLGWAAVHATGNGYCIRNVNAL